MPRKLHTKSRSGCATCKKRHIKCDEGWPRCVRCTTAERVCEYAPTPAGEQGTRTSKKATEHANTVSSPSKAIPRTGPVVDLDHLELLHHFCTVTFETLTPEIEGQKTWQSNAVKVGLAYPFVLYQILGLAALHLAHLRPEDRGTFQTKATKLQNLAMAGFNDKKETIDSSSCGAVLLFSSLLTLQVLADHTHGAETEDNDPIERLLRCFNLVSFSRKLLLKEWEDEIRQSDLAAILGSPAPRVPYTIPEQCQRLNELPDNSDLSYTAAQAYHAAIERLQYNFSLTGAPSRSYCTIRFALAWPMELQDEYLNLLKERRPEALIILAYYAVLLHSFRDSWMVHKSGASLVRVIAASVGQFWEPWLSWPKQIVESSVTNTPV